MPITVERDRNTGVPHVGRQALGVGARRDGERGEGVAAVVKGQPLELPGLPCRVGPPLKLAALERLPGCPPGVITEASYGEGGGSWAVTEK
jgi:hypothetical protein